MQYTADNLIVRANPDGDSETVIELDPESAGWDFIHFTVLRLKAGATKSFDIPENEFGVVVLSGTIGVTTADQTWSGIGRRASVFDGPASALYLPRNHAFEVTAESDCEVAVTWVPAHKDFDPVLVSPEDVPVEIRGGDNVTRQINGIFPPGFPCQRLVVVEVYTPSGGWSSYPPHKHDVHKEDETGAVVEADLEEVYFYKIDKPTGFAYQRVYTDPESPLHKAGYPIDAVVMAQNNDAVLVPEGYHPVVSAPGYVTYYLNVLAGSAQSLANTDDPAHTWVSDTYKGRNPDVPVYPA